MSSSETRLAPCPFCGNAEPTVSEFHGMDCFSVQCGNDDCGGEGGGGFTREEAVEAWNRRAPALARVDTPDSRDDAWVRKVAGAAVQTLADSEPDGACIEAQDLLQGTAAESYFVVSAATLGDIVYCAISNQLYDDQRVDTPDSEPPGDVPRAHMCEDACVRVATTTRTGSGTGLTYHLCDECAAEWDRVKAFAAPVPATGEMSDEQ